MHDKRIIVAASSSGVILESNTIRSLRTFHIHRGNTRFALIIFVSIIVHVGLIVVVRSIQVKPEKPVVIEEIPERFARLIIEKPIPKKKDPLQQESITNRLSEQSVSEKTPSETNPSTPTTAQRKQAQKAVDAQVTKAEQKIRTVGVLGMLTGVGSTAKGPAVTDVLGAIGDKKDRFDDFEKTLEKMSGLKKAPDLDILDKKLIKSKDVSVFHKEEIDDLIAGVGQVSSLSLEKKGDFIIQRPESIEGAASSSTKRDNDAINEIVSSHKASIRMTYEKFLKRDPKLAGKVTVRFTIAFSGSVTMAMVIENTTGNLEFEQEILRKIRMWRFDPIPEGDVTVSYPFVFSASS